VLALVASSVPQWVVIVSVSIATDQLYDKRSVQHAAKLWPWST
jgi:hypothetical protein